MNLRARADHWLREALGPDATFRDGQWESIQALAEARRRVLVVQRTGWGKSLVYFLATRLLREQGAGLTVLISPLLSLMRNQIDAARRLNLRAVTVNSTNYDEHAQIERQLLNDEIDLLLISPERLANDRFQLGVWPKLRPKIGLLVVDEAHCISDWGHDFRPNYRRIMRVLGELAPDVPVIGTTATANSRVIADVSEILGAGLYVLRGPLMRESLSLYAFPQPQSAADRLALLVEMLRKMPGSGIIYCMTTRDCQRVADWLQTNKLNVKAYYSSVEDEGADRVDLEQQLLNNEVKALVASVALGMGFDKPDLSFVIHYQYPGSIISYYQQIGRAGRGIASANIILMHGPEDEDIQRYFIDTAFPHQRYFEQAIDAFTRHDTLTQRDLGRSVNVRHSTLDKILTHLEIEGVIGKHESGYSLLDDSRQPDYERWGRVTEQRYRELAQMQAYLTHEGCLMHFLAQSLDDQSAAPTCGKCQNCLQQREGMASRKPAIDLVEAAGVFLRDGQAIEIEPRKLWPSGLSGVQGKLKPPNQTGVALTNLYDGGWGETVRRVRAAGGLLPEALVEASAKVLIERWKTSKPPKWVTAVPSLRRPTLVRDVAERLATRLGLPFRDVLRKRHERPEQRTMLNSYQQVSNIFHAFVVEDDLLPGPVLLVDDFVDSGWTLTIVGLLLREAGCADVMPFALAKGGVRED
jgi:ATP-dependent DNA helicase RecQ